MRRANLLAFSTFALAAAHASAATLEVGFGQAFTTLPAAAVAARDGDTVNIHPGIYAQGAIWYANRLTLQASAGAKLGAVVIKGTVANKGVFEIKGDDATVIGLDFQYARSTDGNGAGIRSEGHNITVSNCEFFANEMGMLITANVGHQGGFVTVDGSVFDLSGTTVAGHIGHAFYANYVGSVRVTNSTFTRGSIGHYIKSRALTTYVHNNVVDDTNGSASYLINVPQGGAADIQNNVLIKGARAANCCIAISYGEEMHKGGVYVNAPGVVLIANNQFTNHVPTRVTFVQDSSIPANPVTLVTNRLTASSGTIAPLVRAGKVQQLRRLLWAMARVLLG